MNRLFLALIAMAAMPAAQAAATLCASDEQVLFSCPIVKSQKIVSVCGSMQLTATKGYVQYRFGRAGAVEMTFPQNKVNTQAQFGWNTNYHRDVTDNWLTFSHEKYSYGVFSIEDHDVSGDPEGNAKSGHRYGVTIDSPDERRGVSLDCAVPAIGRFETLSEIVPEGHEGPE